MITIKIAGLLSSWEKWLLYEKGLSSVTVENYTRDLVLFVNFVAKKLKKDFVTLILEETLKLDLIYSYFSSEKKFAKARTISRFISSLRSFLKFLDEEGIEVKLALDDIEMPRLEKELPKVLKEEEWQRLVDFDPRKRSEYRLKAILELMYSAGLRVSELVNLRLEDLDFSTRLLRCYGKRGKWRVVPFSERAAYWLKRYLEVYGIKSGKIFPVTRQAVWKVIKRRAMAVGLDIHPHVLRHSIATHFLKKGADLRVVQEFLGHASISTTQIYTHLAKEELKREYMDKIPRL